MSYLKYIASCSFGKDSLAQIIVALQHGKPIDEVMYCEVMFTDEISAEFPEHRNFIYRVAIPKLKKLYGLNTVILRSDTNMWKDFHTIRVRGVNAGKLRGFPIPGLCNINRDCKIKPIKSYLASQTEEYTQYIGIAADEPKRLARLKSNEISILAKYGITEEMATDICKKHDLLSPIYEFTNRNGCFFCPNASVGELRHLYFNRGGLWLMLHGLQEVPNTSRRCFTKSKTIFDYEMQFREEERRNNNGIG